MEPTLSDTDLYAPPHFSEEVVSTSANASSVSFLIFSAEVPIVSAASSVFFAAWGDELQGGDGKVSHYGTTMQELAKNLQDTGTISGDTRQDLFFLNEQLEDTSTPEEYGKNLGDALYNAGVNVSELESAFGTLKTQTSLTDDEIDAITAAIGYLKDKTTEAKDVTKLSADQYQGMHDKLQELGIDRKSVV